jgi:hypothetical protein
MMDEEAVDRWLERIDVLQPADGNLTQEVIEAVGNLPMVYQSGPVRTEEEARMERLRRVADRAEAKAYARTAARFRSDEAGAQLYKLTEFGGNEGEIARYRAQFSYWQSVVRWIEQL